MDGAIVTCEVDDEALDHAIGDATPLIELPHIKQVAGMLTIKRRHQLASVEFVAVQHR
ncbi:hypothetical protein D9M69_683030 [compost metagenome]